MNQSSSLARLLGLALVVGVVCNGASVYLKRTGLASHDDYRAYWATHCVLIDVAPASPREPRPCHSYTTPEEMALAARQLPDYRETTYRYIYEVSASEKWLKLVKDLFWLALIGVSAWMIARGQAALPAVRQAWPIYLLSAYCLGSLVVSVVLNGGLIAAAGLRAFAFLFAAMLARWLVPHIGVFAGGIAALLLFEATLLPFELLRGIHVFHEWSSWALASRTVGTLVQPNSLGIFAIAGLAFCYSFAKPSRRLWWPLCAAALALVLLSGSGTGLICAALACWAELHRRMPEARRWLVAAAGLALAVLAVTALPTLTGREDVLSSLGTGGRFEKLQSALTDRPTVQVAFGSGLGVDTNLALNLTGFDGSGDLPAAAGDLHRPTDSALTSLLIQLGVLGTLLFYAALFWGAWRDPPARPFYCVIALCTLTINVGEVFPVNVLLGIAWAHSASQWRRIEKPAMARHG